MATPGPAFHELARGVLLPVALVNLAVIAVRLNRTLHYDPARQRFTDDEAANRLIDQPMRAPWTL